MKDLLADSTQSPLLRTPLLSQKAHVSRPRMPRAAASAQKRQQGAASSLSSSSSSTKHDHVKESSRRSSAAKHHRNVPGSPAPANGHAPASAVPSTAASDSSYSSNPVLGPSPPLVPANGFAKHAAAAEHRRDSLGSSSVSSSSAAESFTSQSSIHISDDSHRRIDITTMKNPEVHRDPGPMGFMLTVVKSCPASDTLAILVLLMQLASPFLSFVYVIFTYLTFIPTTSVVSFSSFTFKLAAVKQVFHDANFNLSYLSIFAVDTLVMLLWLFLWESVQNVVLDLAKMVIALTLGGGVNSKGGGWRGIFGCLAVIAFSHFTHHSRFHIWLGQYLRVSWLAPSRADPDDPLESISTSIVPTSWVKAGRYFQQLLALHIMTQGIVRYTREWLLRRERREHQAHPISDPEAGKPSNFSDTSSSTDAGFATPDVDHATLQSATASMSSRKKRKQNTQVRIRQPLWAAIASTKIVMTKEMELNNPGRDSDGKLSEVNNMSSASFHEQQARIWLSDVDSEDAFFATSVFPKYPPLEGAVIDPEHPDSSSLIDASKPFYVRINNAVWPSTQMYPVAGSESDSGVRWTGRIAGLPAASNFICEFLSTRDAKIIHATSFRTRPAPAKEADAVASPAQTPRTRRPESPVTTLKTSIKNLEARLSDEKNRLKSLRKDNQTKVKSQKKELERLASSIQSSGNNDSKYRQKIQANAHLKQQYEEQAAQLDSELGELRSSTEVLVNAKDSSESVFNDEKDLYSKAQAEFKAFRCELDRLLKSVESENASLQNKRNKIAVRIAKLDNDLSRISDLTAKGIDEAERRRREQTLWEATRSQVENSYRDRIKGTHARNEDLERQIQAVASMAAQYYAETQAQAAQAAQVQTAPAQSGHLVEDGIEFQDLTEQGQTSTKLNPAAPHYNPTVWNPTMLGFAPSPWTTAASTPTTRAIAPIGTGQPRGRGRSSSMLSDMSGFTHLSDDGTETIGTTTVVPTPSLITPLMTAATPSLGTSAMTGNGGVIPPPLDLKQLSSLASAASASSRLPPGLRFLRRSETSASAASKVSGGSGDAGSP